MNDKNLYRLLRKISNNTKFLKGIATTFVLSISLSGCFLIDGPQPDSPERLKPVVSTTNPVYVPDGTASENLDFFTLTLQKYAESETDFNGRNIANSLLEAGFQRVDMQVTFDESVTQLPADTITVSVRFNEECLLGQVERKNREVYVFQTETVGPNNDICIIGKTADF